MDNEQVVRILKKLIQIAEQEKEKYSVWGFLLECADEKIEAYTMAIAALEQQIKEPCDYCKGEKPIRNDGKKGFYAEIQGNILYVQYTRADGFHDNGFISADYCLKCGRKLEG